MTEGKLLTKQRMVVIPLPPAFRVNSKPEQFPVLYVYKESLRFLGKTLPFSEIEDLCFEDAAIKFTALGEEYSYAAQGYNSKEVPCLEITKSLFKLIAALHVENYTVAEEVMSELKKSRRTAVIALAVVATGAVVFHVIMELISEFG